MDSKNKMLLSSIASIALCSSIAVGGTFALFTSESQVNIAVTAGKVKVSAEIVESSLKTSSSLSTFNYQATEENGYTANFENGGTATFSNADGVQILKLTNVTPGDKAEFQIKATNESNVAIQYRFAWAVDGKLSEALEATVQEEDAEVVELVTNKTEWAKWEDADNVKTFNLAVYLPETVDNTYQEQKASISFLFEAVQGNVEMPDEWNGTTDTAWYNETDTEFTLNTAEQIAGLAELVDAGNTFAGKTIKLDGDTDLYAEDENGEPISFEPIGSFSDNKPFEGTFDGQGHTISNLHQNGWALQNGYWDGPEYGMGFFSLVENAAIKNVNFDGASLPSEANIMGVVAGGAANCVFENINITDAYLGNHSWYSGGAIGWAEGDVKLINCDIDASSVVSSQWGDFNNANGGLIGGIDPQSTIYLKDCDVACVIDAYNDVTSAYKWYSYRSCGMLIGDTGQIDDPDGNNVGNAIAPNLTCENVTVTYGNWANYHYCEFGSSNYPFCRVEAGESTGAYGNARVGEYFDANGNKVVDDNHVHNDGEKHNELIVFDQLYGGESGDRYCTYGTATHEGVTVVYNNK